MREAAPVRRGGDGGCSTGSLFAFLPLSLYCVVKGEQAALPPPLTIRSRSSAPKGKKAMQALDEIMNP